MRSLDQFYRYIQQSEGRATDAPQPAEPPATTPVRSNAAPSGRRPAPPPDNDSASRRRYVLRNGITLCIQEADDDSGESARSPNGTDAPVGGTNDVGSVNGAVHKNGAQWDDVDLAAMTATSIAMDAADAARWRALPNALRLLAHLAAEANGANGLSGASGEADGRRDDRTLLIERILNPMLSLEDAARLIGVHPGTIRRWANKGTLPHQRTVGQQRRFHLADVLAAMERREHEDSTTGAPEQAP